MWSTRSSRLRRQIVENELRTLMRVFHFFVEEWKSKIIKKRSYLWEKIATIKPLFIKNGGFG